MAVFRTIPAGDLLLEGGNLVIIGDTAATRVQYIRQKLSCRFRFFAGEWFLDQREGIPYFRDVFVKNPNLPLIRSLFMRVVLKTPGVLSVPEFSLDWDRVSRRLRFDFQAVVDDAVIVVRPEDEDFIVDVAQAA